MTEQAESQPSPEEFNDPSEEQERRAATPPEPGYPADETEPYGDADNADATPPIGDEDQDDGRTTEPAADDEAGVPDVADRTD